MRCYIINHVQRSHTIRVWDMARIQKLAHIKQGVALIQIIEITVCLYQWKIIDNKTF